MDQPKVKTPLNQIKKRGIPNLSTRQSLLQDQEQIAIQSLLNTSNHHSDIMIEQDQFNNTFDLFGSTYSSQLNPQFPSMVSRMSEKINRNRRHNSFSFSVDKLGPKKEETSDENIKTKNQYQKDSERGSVKSASVRIRNEKNVKESLLKQKKIPWLDSLKTETVFVGKISQKLLNQKTNQKILLQKYNNFQNDSQSVLNNQINHAKLNHFFKQLSFRNSHPQSTPFSINKFVQNKIIDFSPTTKLQTFCQQPAKTQRLKRLTKMNPFSQNSLSIHSEFKEQRTLACWKQAHDLETMNNMKSDKNDSKYCFRGRHVAHRRQIK